MAQRRELTDEEFEEFQRRELWRRLKAGEWLTPPEVARLADVTRHTPLNWCRGIDGKPGKVAYREIRRFGQTGRRRIEIEPTSLLRFLRGRDQVTFHPLADDEAGQVVGLQPHDPPPLDECA